MQNTLAQLQGQKVGAFSKKDVLESAIKTAIYNILKVNQQFDLIEAIQSRADTKQTFCSPHF